MIDYGVAPLADELEVTIFGPGFGEAIAVHLGENQWLLVDSCIDPDTKRPAAQSYLDQIGVPVTAVRAIVASHWHDDHVRGLSQLAAHYSGAELHISNVFSDDEAKAFLAAYNNDTAPKLGRGTAELYKAINLRDPASNLVWAVQQRSIILGITLPHSNRQVQAAAFSPLPAAFARSLARLASFRPSGNPDEPIGHAPELRLNLEAISIHIDWGDDAVLLGADLEEHATYGWSAVIADQWCSSRKRASVYKVAHHGGASGDVPGIWQTLLGQPVVACLTPFNLGGVRLPEDADRARIRGYTQHAFITSGGSRKPAIGNEKLKRLGDICDNLSIADSRFGSIRIRRRFDEAQWRIELFGAATQLR